MIQLFRGKCKSFVLFIIAFILMGHISSITGAVKPEGTLIADASFLVKKPSVTNFYRTSGTAILSPDGQPYQIKGISFCNKVYNWSAQSDPYFQEPLSYANESTYREIASLGFNSVRFYLNYRFFVESSAGTYNELAFQWIDQNIEWAKKYGVSLLLNMHISPSGKPDQKTFWEYTHNQTLLDALWKEIATRYADNPTILGYGLLNEPTPLYDGNAESSLASWKRLAQRLTNTIRKVDKNHILFVEKAIAAQDLQSNSMRYQLNDEKNFIIVDDPCNNMVLEFHYYQPWIFSGMSDSSKVHRIWTYPNPDLTILWGHSSLKWNPALERYGSSITKTPLEDGWRRMESDLLTSDQLNQAFHVQLAVENLGDGTAYVDDITVSSYKEDGSFAGELLSLNFDSYSDPWKVEYGAQGRAAMEAQKGFNGTYGMVLHGGGQYTLFGATNSIRLSVQPGYSYRVSAKVKVSGGGSGTQVYPHLSFYLVNGGGPFTRDTILGELRSYQAIGEKYNIPVYMGEFGVSVETFARRGGKQLTRDLLNFCTDTGLHFNYHAYSTMLWGLYLVDTKQPGKSPDLNDGLWEVFSKTLAS